MHKETSLCDTICLVVELLRHHLIEVFQFLILQDLCMQLCNTVDRITCNDCKVCHLHLAVHQDCHLLNLFFITRILCSYLLDETAVDLLDDLVNTWKQFGEQVDRPFLKCFCHNCMVRVCTAFCCDIPCFVPSEIFLVKKDTHKLCYCYCRVCIIHLECYFLRKFADIVMFLFKLRNCSLDTC